MNVFRRPDPASDLEVRFAALELIIEQLVATSMDAHPDDWAAFESTFDGVVDDMPRVGLADALNAAAAGDVLSILRAARRRSDMQAGARIRR